MKDRLKSLRPGEIHIKDVEGGKVPISLAGRNSLSVDEYTKFLINSGSFETIREIREGENKVMLVGIPLRRPSVDDSPTTRRRLKHR